MAVVKVSVADSACRCGLLDNNNNNNNNNKDVHHKDVVLFCMRVLVVLLSTSCILTSFGHYSLSVS